MSTQVIPPADLVLLAREALVLVVVISLPLFGAALLAGLATAALQALSKIQEPTLTHVPRIAAVAVALLAVAPWASARIAAFAERLWSLIQAVGGPPS